MTDQWISLRRRIERDRERREQFIDAVRTVLKERAVDDNEEDTVACKRASDLLDKVLASDRSRRFKILAYAFCDWFVSAHINGDDPQLLLDWSERYGVPQRHLGEALAAIRAIAAKIDDLNRGELINPEQWVPRRGWKSHRLSLEPKSLADTFTTLPNILRAYADFCQDQYEFALDQQPADRTAVALARLTAITTEVCKRPAYSELEKILTIGSEFLYEREIKKPFPGEEGRIWTAPLRARTFRNWDKVKQSLSARALKRRCRSLDVPRERRGRPRKGGSGAA